MVAVNWLLFVTYVYAYVFIHIYMDMYVYIHMHIDIYTCTHIHIHIYTHFYVYKAGEGRESRRVKVRSHGGCRPVVTAGEGRESCQRGPGVTTGRARSHDRVSQKAQWG